MTAEQSDGRPRGRGRARRRRKQAGGFEGDVLDFFVSLVVEAGIVLVRVVFFVPRVLLALLT